MTAGTTLGDVDQYAAAVRRHLADLTAEQVEDLTDDLELDLQDALGDERRVAAGRTLTDLLGTPEAYATELRVAAGLGAPQGDAPRRRLRSTLLRPVRATRSLGARVLRTLRDTAWWPPVESFGVALRPVWWVVRAWVVFVLLARVAGLDAGYLTPWVPRTLASGVLLLVCLVVSVQWGRGLWLRAPRLRWVTVGVNLLAVVALLPTVSSVYENLARHQQVYDQWARGAINPAAGVVYRDRVTDGVVVDGMQVSNLFVYDADGNPLTDVQIYDDRGRPVRTTFDDGYGTWSFPGSTEPWQFVGASSQDGVARWNVYPLRGAPASAFRWDDEGRVVLPEGVEPALPPMPFAKAPAVHPATGSTPGADTEPRIDGTVVADGASPAPSSAAPSSEAPATP